MPRKLKTIYEEETPKEDKLEKIMEKLESIEKRTEALEKKLENTSDNCQKMSNHIDFVEGVYQSLKYPLEYIKSKVTFGDTKELPSPQN